MARCGFGFGRWFTQGVICSAMLLALAGCGEAVKDGGAGAEESGSRAQDASVPATRINATKGTVVSGPSEKPTVPVVPSQNSSATSATVGAADKLVVTGKVTTDDGADFGTTVVVSVFSSTPQVEGRPLFDVTTTTLGTDQTYRVEVAPPASGEVFAAAKGFLVQRRSLASEESAKPLTAGVITQDFVLVRGAEISGRLVSADGAPLSGWVEANSPKNDGSSSMGVGAHERATEKDGFSITVPKGEVKLQAWADGYAPVWRKLTAPTSGVEIRLGEGATIEGRVLLLATGQGVSSASVSLLRKNPENRESGSSAISDSSGHFRINGVSDGTYRCYSNAEDLFPVRGGKGSAEVTVTSGVANLKPELFLFPGYTVSGRVTDEELGAPIEGVKVSQRGGRNEVSALTDSDGRYKLFPVGYEMLTVKKEGWVLGGGEGGSNMFNPVRGESSMSVKLGDKLVATHDFTMREELTVSGKVTLANGDAVPGGEVKTLSTGGRGTPTIKTSADGSYRIRVFRNTSVRVKAWAPGYPPVYSDPLEVGDSPVTGIDFILKAGGTLSGVVLDPKGKPAPGAKVKAIKFVYFANMGLGDWTAEALSNEEGLFALLNVPSNDVLLGAEKEGFAPAERMNVSVGEGETRKGLTLSLRTAHFIAGRVLDSRKNPIGGAELSFSGSSGTFDSTKSDVNGNYRIEGLADDRYIGNCSVEKSSWMHMSIEQIKVDRADVDFVFEEAKEKANLDANVTFVCKVLDAKTRQLVRTFEVAPCNWEISRDPAEPGTFRFEGKTHTLFEMTVMADGYTPEKKTVSAERGGPAIKEVEFLMGPGASVIGRVVSKGDKAPLEGLKISLAPPSPYQGHVPDHIRNATKWATSQADGQFVFPQVTGGDQLLETKSGNGREAITKSVKVEDHKVNDLGDIEVGTGGTLRVKFLRNPGEQAMAGVPVNISLSQNSPNSGSSMERHIANTDGDGLALFESLPAGPYSVRNQSGSVYGSCTVKEGEVTEYVMALGTGTLSGLVTFEGEPLPQCQITLSTKGEGADEKLNFGVQTNWEGRYTINDLPAGSYKVTASYHMRDLNSGNSFYRTLPLDIKGEGEQKLDINMPSGSLTGRVVDADGNPVDRADISLTGSNAREGAGVLREVRSARSDNTGTFFLRGLAGGTYSVFARHFSNVKSKTETVEVPPNGEAPPITLQLLPVAP